MTFTAGTYMHVFKKVFILPNLCTYLATTDTWVWKKTVKTQKLILFTYAVFSLVIVKAQAPDKWQIFFNKQLIFNGNSDQPNSTGNLKISSIRKTDKITISYFMDSADDDWKRSFLVNDETERNILTIDLNKQAGSASFNAIPLKPLKDKKKPFFIYTISLPKDPGLAARVRVKRVLLCKIEWNKL
jgi:hypothetical protein